MLDPIQSEYMRFWLDSSNGLKGANFAVTLSIIVRITVRWRQG
jgi:hypothetical protein